MRHIRRTNFAPTAFNRKRIERSSICNYKYKAANCLIIQKSISKLLHSPRLNMRMR